MAYDKKRAFTQRAIQGAVLALVASGGSVATLASAAAFGSGSLVVYNIGSEKGAKTVSLREFQVDGKAVQTVAVVHASGGALAASSTGSEGLLTRSANGQCLAVPGYAAAPGDTVLKGSAASVAQRAVALVHADGAVASLQKLGAKAFDGDSIRSAATADCAGAWASGRGGADKDGGLWYASAATPNQLAAGNMQGLAAAGQLFVSVASGGTLNQVGAGMPTVGQPTLTPVNGLPPNNFRGIAFATLNPASAGADTLYIAVNDLGVIQKYVLSGSTWVLKGAVALAGVHGLAAMPTGDGHAVLFATDGAGALFRLFDTSGAQGVLSGTPEQLLAPNTKESFLGVAVAPDAHAPAGVPLTPTTLAVSKATANSATLQWAAAGSGPAPAFYVVEVSGDNFASVSQSQVTTTTSVELSQLQSGQTARVRAVNSVGGSASAQTGAILGGGAAPTATLPTTVAYAGIANDGAVPPADPLAADGIRFTVANPASTAADLTISAQTSNALVLPNAGIQIARDPVDPNQITVRLAAQGVGYATVTLTIAAPGGASITRTIQYAASSNKTASVSTRWYEGRSDASSALLLADGSMMVIDDEAPAQDAAGNALPGGNSLFAYNPQTGGMPVSQRVPDAGLDLMNDANCKNVGSLNEKKCKTDGEVDMEASFQVGSRAYVLGSHSNSKNGYLRPDRWRVFALDMAKPAMPTTGYYQWLREDLRNWDQGNIHKLGADYFGLVASSNDGAADQAPEADTLSGFSIEGSTTSPDDAQMWLGFRAPLVPAPGQPAVISNSAAGRTHALLMPIGNYAALTSAPGGTRGSAQVGQPIRIDLGGRGIREIRKTAANDYLVIAGPPNGANGKAPRDFRLFSWDGRTNLDGLALNVRELDANLAPITAPNTQCSAEGIAQLPATLAQGGVATIISDCGDADFYADGKAAKELEYAAWKKFRSDEVQIAPLPTVDLQAVPGTGVAVQSASAGQFRAVLLPAGTQAPRHPAGSKSWPDKMRWAKPRCGRAMPSRWQRTSAK